MNLEVSKVTVNGKSVLLRKLDDEKKTGSGIVLLNEKTQNYVPGEVIKIGNLLKEREEVIDSLKEGSKVLYHKNRVTEVMLSENGKESVFYLAEDYFSCVKVILDS